MDLSRSVSAFANHAIYVYAPLSGQWEDSGLKGGLQVYDRFISDRVFGQRKRILTIGGSDMLPDYVGLIRLEGVPCQFLVESENVDSLDVNIHASIYNIRRATHAIKVCKDEVAVRASGYERSIGERVLCQTWADYERTTSVASKEFPDVDYVRSTIYLSRHTRIDTDCYLRMDGKVFDVLELNNHLSLLSARIQERGSPTGAHEGTPRE